MLDSKLCILIILHLTDLNKTDASFFLCAVQEYFGGLESISLFS